MYVNAVSTVSGQFWWRMTKWRAHSQATCGAHSSVATAATGVRYTSPNITAPTARKSINQLISALRNRIDRTHDALTEHAL